MNGKFIWDDDAYVQNNALLRSDDGLRQIWFSFNQPSQYFPMVYTSFRFEYALWGLNPLGYHITNIMLHAVNALLLWWVLRRLSVPGAWLAAAIFALHPVHVESVAWITERKNVLVAFFSLLCLLAWVRFADRSHKAQLAWPAYILSLVLYVLALFSKTTACMLPAALVLLLWLKHIPIDSKRWWQITPYVLLGLAMGMLTVWWETEHLGTSLAPDVRMSMVAKLLVASRALWFYVGKLFWPVNLAFSYPCWEIDAMDPLQYRWLLGCLVVAYCMWRWRDKVGRDCLTAVAFFAVTLFPMLGFFSLYTFVYTYVADHYQYVASIGPIALFAAATCRIVNRFNKPGRSVATVIAVLVLITLGTLTWRQCHIYKDLETLWRDTLKKNPDSWLANNNYGEILHKRGQIDQAIEHYRTALRVKPDYWQTHFGMGTAMFQLRQFDNAISHFQKALENSNIISNTNKSIAYNKLGIALLKKGKLDDSITNLRKALLFNPASAETRYNLALALIQQGKMNEAESHYHEAMRIKPNYATAHENIGDVYLVRGKIEEAIACWNRVFELDPGRADIINDIAWLRATHERDEFRDPEEALRLAQRACELTGYGRPNFLDTLAAAYAAAGKFPEAIETAKKAINLARLADRKQLANEIQTHLQLYERERACCD
jgi:tetratricopeptide (TPR) repeat protein